MGKIHHGYGIFWSYYVGSGPDYSGPVRGCYVRVCSGKLPIGASLLPALLAALTPGRYRAGDTMPILKSAVWCRFRGQITGIAVFVLIV